ncbi:FG-GAP-like repeat-containing protein [Draconibacterium sediminis]|uniref:FG-GAP-like repeat-containing protein n=1 Tax=Draconibacterium sediminis TaxID=1544798 RepID=UPI0026EE03A4|nr:FG-GAP-like repeat-containing protein [Draconibacterium sediminis]
MGTNSKNNCLSLEIFTGISGNRFSQQGLSEQQIQKVYTKKRNPWSGALKTFVILFSLGLFSLQVSAQLIGGSAISAGGEGNYGVIDGAASGTADVYGNGPYDLFVGLRTLYPFERFDDYGTPVYGEKVTISSPNSGGYVFQHTDGEIYALSYSNAQIQLLSFDRSLLEFKTIASHKVDKMSGSLSGFIDKQGKLHVFHVSNDETEITDAGDRAPFPSSRSSRNKDDVPYHHQKEYNAYDGAGLAKNPSWYSRGPRLFHAQFSDIKMTTLEKNEPVDVDSRNCYFKFGSRGLTMAIYNSETKIPQVVGANQTGLTRVFQNISVDGVDINEVRYAVDATPEHVILRHPVIHPNVKTITNPKNGLSDLLIGDTGRLWFYPLKGMLNDNTPIYGEPRLVLSKSSDILCGRLPVISPGDVDDDGLVDFLVGNDAGELLFAKNIGSKEAPEFANPVPILVDGKTFQIRAGYQGSIQGPPEANWGYTCPTLYDWNNDGKLDIVMNSILGDIVTFIQIESEGNRPAFSEMKKIFCEGLDLHLSWRTQPGITTWGGETEPCIIANDENNEFRCFYQIDIQNVVRGEVLRLETGEAIRAHDKRFVGQWGRSKIVPVDWDLDGKIDLMVGTSRAQSIPGPGGMPDNLEGNERQACVLFMKNVGTNAKPVFEYPVRIKYKEEAIKLGTHSCSPAPVDLGRGVLDLMVAREKGTLMYYNRENLSSTKK